ncbi:amidohydrolase family protein [Haliea sp. E1-2-M8]|uniref:amidohydrolase family protein n=1 Tax=Haliea sp. E1-2-M8 TaxID=3064706 RepID=UPI00271D90A4|nr:amidohydrolase family protein [Haliea sp. E1-2-M8]MDO8861314.1 amidohydrolase family protein [Haliea sp. E1-2-M8]
MPSRIRALENGVRATAFAVLALGCAACVNTAATAPAAQMPKRSQAAFLPGKLFQDVSPSTDHHKHLMGPAIARAASGAPLADAINVPAEIKGLLARRERSWNDPRELSSLYFADSALLSESRRGWLFGKEDIAAYLVQRFGSAYSMTPVHFLRQGDAAHLSGYYTRGAPPAQQHLGYFQLSLLRNDNGWIIATEIPRFPIAPGERVRTAEELVAEMDRADIRRSVVLSEAFWADGPMILLEDPYPVVMEENDWTAAQVESFPDRLVAFCSFNPVADHALDELDRCAANPTFRGLKFSFGMSGVDLNYEDHVLRLRGVFAAANQHRFPLVVHLRGGQDYGAEQVRVFLNQIVSVAPDIVIQVPHLWGGEAYSRAALEEFANAIEAGEHSTNNLYFDLSEISAEVSQTSSTETQQEVAALIRRIGIPRMLFGSDGQDAYHSWRSLVGFIPLNEQEFRTITGNVAPYLR